MHQLTVRDLLDLKACITALPPAADRERPRWSRFFLMQNGHWFARVEKRLATKGYAAALVISRAVSRGHAPEERQLAVVTGTHASVMDGLMSALTNEFARGDCK